MKIFIQPNDVLFFRDGKPFEAGGDHIARLNFPPTPITFYGAIRTALISLELKNFDDFKDPNNLSKELKEVVGFANKIGVDTSGKPIFEICNGTLKITGFGMGILNSGKLKKIYPVPADVVKEKNNDKYFILIPGKMDVNEKVNMPIKDLLPLTNNNTVGKFLEEPAGFITEDGLNAYWKSEKLSENHFINVNEIFKCESRVCVSRDYKTHTAKEGMLYSIEFARMNEKVNDRANDKAGFFIEIEGLDKFEEKMKTQKAIRLGGESKSALCNYKVDWDSPVKPHISENLKVVTLTHSIFDNGWLPDGIDSNGEGKIEGVEVKLISAAMRKHVGIGGWDIVNNKSKPVRRAVPAGSVFLFKVISGNSERLSNKRLINIGQETEKGLGQAIIGGF